MSDANREQLTAILEDLYGYFVRTVAGDLSKSHDDVEQLINDGIYQVHFYDNTNAMPVIMSQYVVHMTCSWHAWLIWVPSKMTWLWY